MRRSIGAGVALVAAAAASIAAAGGCAAIAGLEEPPSGVGTSSGGAGPGSGGAGGDGGSTSASGGGGGSGGSGGSGAGGGCDPGAGPVAVVTGQVGPTVIAADASGIYWATNGAGPDDYGIWKMATPCSTPVRLARPEQRKPLAIAVDGIDIYWSETGEGVLPSCSGSPMPPEDGRDRIMRVAKGSAGGADPGTFVYGMCGEATAIALGGDRVYWSRPDANRVQGIHKETGAFISLSYDPGSTPQGIVADAGAVFWGDSQLGVIRSYTGSFPVTTLVQAAGPARFITMDAQAVYWTAGAELRTNPRGTPDVPDMLYTGINQAAGITTDAAAPVVYVADTGAARILLIPKDAASPAPEPIPTGPSAIGGVALDETHVYWTQTDTGEIWRAPR